MTTETTPKKKTVRAPKAKKEETELEKTASNETTDTEVVAVTPEGDAAVEIDNRGYLYGLGRRKTSIARVRLHKKGKGKITINGRPMEEMFTTYELRSIVQNALKVSGQETALDVEAFTTGGGIRGQAEAVRLGISRALIILNPTFRKTLKKMGFLTRDPRAKERKKFGLKKARRAPQWSKR